MYLTKEEAAMADLLDEMGMTMESIEFTEECIKKKMDDAGTKIKNAYYDYYADPYIKFIDKHIYRGKLRSLNLHKNNPFRERNKKYWKEFDEREEKRRKAEKSSKDSFDDFDIDMEFWDILNQQKK